MRYQFLYIIWVESIIFLNFEVWIIHCPVLELVYLLSLSEIFLGLLKVDITSFFTFFSRRIYIFLNSVIRS